MIEEYTFNRTGLNFMIEGIFLTKGYWALWAI